MKIQMVNTYKLRAECMVDLMRYMIESHGERANSDHFGTRFIVDITGGRLFPEPTITCEFGSPKSLEDIKKDLAKIPDSHVMVETVNYKNLYTGVRNSV